jgi:BMFP domain-containing protein YqiC
LQAYLREIVMKKELIGKLLNELDIVTYDEFEPHLQLLKNLQAEVKRLEEQVKTLEQAHAKNTP